MKIEIKDESTTIPEEIVHNGVSFIKKEIAAEKTKKAFKDVFACKSIKDLFEFANEDIEAFKVKHGDKSPRKLAHELIEKGIEILNQGWKATMKNTWYYPVFKRTESGFSFNYVFFVFDYDYYDVVPASLALETEKLAKHAGNILLSEYDLMMKPHEEK